MAMGRGGVSFERGTPVQASSIVGMGSEIGECGTAQAAAHNVKGGAILRVLS